VRFRATVGAVAVVAAALALGGILLVGVMYRTLTEEVQTSAESRAAEVVAVLQAGGSPALAVSEPDEQLIQIVDLRGNVVDSSQNMKGEPALPWVPLGGSARIRVPIHDSVFAAVAMAVDTPQGRLIVVSAQTLEDVIDATRLVAGLLSVGLPAMLLLVGFTIFKVIGRALAPVEAIREEVDEISATELHRRVPDPPGTDEISRLARTMNRMLGRLERSHARQQRFISDASHELRSPVASIRQHAEVALAHPDRTTTTELAEAVLAEDLRVERLVDDLLLLARADEHTLALRRRPLDLDDLVFEEARRLREATTLGVGTSAVSAGRIVGDAASLRRALRNLADNAAHHAKSRVAFSLRAPAGEAVTLTVEDDGPGIPESERERVFERFVRLDDARARDHGGSGLGLAIVAEIVRAHAGSVVIGESRLGGARVEVAFPVARPDAAPAPEEPGGNGTSVVRPPGGAPADAS
jgi:signal transduction histidine kinase